jgi:hypothetical protein
LENFTAVWHILWPLPLYLSRFGMFYQENLATLFAKMVANMMKNIALDVAKNIVVKINA